MHLSAVTASGESLAEGVPVACQAVMAPGRSSPRFPAGNVSAVPRHMFWNMNDADGLAIAGLTSKAVGMTGQTSENLTTKQVWTLRKIHNVAEQIKRFTIIKYLTNKYWV